MEMQRKIRQGKRAIYDEASHIAGDVNQLDINCLLNQHSLAQIVKIPTRDVRTLDVFITNFPQLWSKVRAIKSLVRSDHLEKNYRVS